MKQALALALAASLWLTPASPARDEGVPDKGGSATLIVQIVPDARLEVEGVPTRSAGAERRFTSPTLEPGREYTYTLVARWEPNNYTKIARKKVVPVRAGATVRVDLTRPDPREPDDIRIRYVPTPEPVVETMCKLAGVGKDDVVFDLGCGDGRIVIAAVEKHGARKGVGVDIDPERIKECRANAARTMVQDRLEFRLEDVFKVKDLDQATVVMLYMSNELNEQLRPILQQKLKPGARVVSHRFTMGDWKPEKTESLVVDGDKYLVHLWTIRAPTPRSGPSKDKKDGKGPGPR